MAVTVDTNAKLLVTGASGNLGQQVVKYLLDTLKVAPSNIVAGSRSPDKLKEFTDRGVTTVALDFNDGASVEAAAKGVDRALVISGNDIFGRLAGHKTAVTALVAAGVKHILYTSFHNVEHSLAFVSKDHLETEQLIRDSNVSYTFLRNGLYMDDLNSIAGAKYSGKWFTAAGNGKTALICRDDLALAAASALASNNYENQIYEISGAAALSVDEVVANVSKALGREIEVVHVSTDELAKILAKVTGMPEDVTKVFTTFDASAAAGKTGDVTSDFKTLTGRGPVTHAQWVEANAGLIQAL